MKGILKINGKEIEIELTEEQKQAIKEAEKPAKLTGWESVGYDKYYYTIGRNGYIERYLEADTESDIKCYDDANYFSTKEKAKEIAFETELFRKLRRFADENNEEIIDWHLWNPEKWYIFIFRDFNKLKVGSVHDMQTFGQVYFTSEKLAKKALETFRPELEKYYGINQK